MAATRSFSAAFTPALFTELYDQFQDRLPTDETLRVHLIRRGFNTRSAIEAIRAYRDTMAFVEEEGASLSTADEDVDDVEDEAPLETMRMPGSVVSRQQAVRIASPIIDAPEEDGEKRSFRLTPTSEAIVHLRGTVTQEAIDMLIAYLNLSKNAYPKNDAANVQLTAHVEDVSGLVQWGHDDGQEEA